MRFITAREVESALDWPSLIERLRTQFRRGATVPLRHHHAIDMPGRDTATLLLMPAWTDGGYIGVKQATVFPDNPKTQNKPSVIGIYLLLSGKTGAPVALLDGTVLTLKRTAAASALAAKYLARPDANRLLMVGAGQLAPYLIAAHAAVRPIREVLIWNRHPASARKLAHNIGKSLARPGWSVHATEDLEGAVHGADIISCATLSRDPLIHGAWLPDGVHIDLVGAFTPEMRETDDDVMRQCRIFVDTRDGALAEGGDIVAAINNGTISANDIAADLFELTRGEKDGRRFYAQRTVFKSVGTALEDLAAAVLAAERT